MRVILAMSKVVWMKKEASCNIGSNAKRFIAIAKTLRT